MKIKNLQQLYKYIVTNKQTFESLNNNCERIGNEVYEDEDWNEFLRSINTEEINRTELQITLSDGNITATIDYIEEPNRFGDFGNETIFKLDTIQLKTIRYYKIMIDGATLCCIKTNIEINMANIDEILSELEIVKDGDIEKIVLLDREDEAYEYYDDVMIDYLNK